MANYFGDIYRNKKVLVTGHTGFKGSWLSLWLTELGARAVGYSLKPPTEPNLFESIGLEDKIAHVIGDVRDEEHLRSVFEEHQPDVVFHLAAQSLVRLSYREPKLTYATNVVGTVNLLEAARKTSSVRACITVTSDKCYENREWIYGYRETDPMGGYDPYSSSKGCAELVTSAYRRSFFSDYGKTHNTALASVRAGNVIGGGDWGEDRLIPDCVRAFNEEKGITLRSPSAVRPWQYVLEPLSGYLRLGALMCEDGARYSDPWNFGPDDESMITVEELVKLIIKHWGGGAYTTDTSNHPHEVNLLKLDAGKARTMLGWKPAYNVFEAVERTVNWYKQFYTGMSREELYQFTVRETLEYASRMNGRVQES